MKNVANISKEHISFICEKPLSLHCQLPTLYDGSKFFFFFLKGQNKTETAVAEVSHLIP
jgi:hypothetical protein